MDETSSTASPASPVDQLASLPPGNPSGRDTFKRYRYQVKIAVSYWLQTLVPDGPAAVYLEHVEDISLAYSDRVVFAQVKTRVPGKSKWTFTEICKPKGGLDSLLRAYRENPGVDAELHLILEGDASRTSPTAEFFDDPAREDGPCRADLRTKLEATDEELRGWLPRLKIRPGSARITDIDQQNILLLAELIPTTPYYVIFSTYEELLAAAELAQEGHPSSHLKRLTQGLAAGNGVHAAPEAMTPDRLVEMLPCKPVSVPLTAFRKSSISDLERKLRLNNASDTVIAHAKEARALADIRRRQLINGPSEGVLYYESMAASVRKMAEILASPHRAETNCADRVFAKLVESESSLRQYDPNTEFSAPLELVGVICQESDECRFPWRVP